MMPKPFFLCALAPGIIAGEAFAHGWMRDCVFLLTNSIAYALAVFSIIAIIQARSRRD